MCKDEINLEELDMVAGGYYTQEEWEAMTTAERRAAQQDSLKKQAAGEPCKTFDPNL